MISSTRPFSVARVRRRIALAMAFAVLFGGIVQASHFHKDDIGRHGDLHPQCLLCLYSTGNAGPPELPRMVRGPLIKRPIFVVQAIPSPQSIEVASYDARGPPLI
jgi:hypothetical protein